MLRRLRTGLIGLGLCCVFAAATVGMAIVSTVALSSLTEQRALWAGMLAVVALLWLVWATDGLPERDECCQRASARFGFSSVRKPTPDMARGP